MGNWKILAIFLGGDLEIIKFLKKFDSSEIVTKEFISEAIDSGDLDPDKLELLKDI